MNFKLRKIGSITLPKGISKRCSQLFSKKIFIYRDVSGKEASKQDENKLLNIVSAYTKIDKEHFSTSGLLAFKEVDRHNDYMNHALMNGKSVAPGLLHVVLKGPLTLNVGNVIMKFKRGDVFIMNPNVNHEVTSSNLCVTHNWVIPLHHSLKTIRANQS